MRYGTRTSSVALLAALLGTVALAACGGGGSNALPAVGTAPTQSQSKMAQGKVTAIIPAATTPQGSKRSPKYLNSSDPNSAIVISVQPTDPAEAAQWQTLYGTAGFTLCYNLYTNGTPNAALNPTPVPGGVQVSFQIPAVPGNDAFAITQYDGQCNAANPYAPPSPSPTANGNGVLASAPPITININPGIANNFNVQLTACGAPASTGGPCSNATPPPGTPPTVVQLGATVATVYLGGSSPAPAALAAPIPVPIAQPIREIGSFVTAGNHVGIPIPVVGLDSAGYVISGATASGAGALPKAGDYIKLSHTETGPAGAVSGHALLYLVDATTGSVAQTEVPGTTPITLTQLNALDAADNVSGLGTVGDPYVVVLATDASNFTGFTASTVTLNAKLNGAVQLNPQTETFAEQGAVFTASFGAPSSGYADAGGPFSSTGTLVSTFGSGLAGSGTGIFVPNASTIAEVGVGQWTLGGGTLNLTGMAYDANASVKQLFTVDIGATLGSLQSAPATGATASGLWMFDPISHASMPVAVQYGQTNSYIGFQNPQSVVYMPNGYVYVLDNGGHLWAIDPQSNGAGTGITTVTNGATTYVQAEAIGQVPVSGLSTGAALSIAGVAVPPSTILLADPGNNRIASINVTTGAVSTFASGGPFAGISAGPVAGTYYAGDLAGQLWKISGGVATSFGMTTGGLADGPVGGDGTFPPFGGAKPYAVQGTPANFFGSAPLPTLPYNLPPFNAAGPVFAPAAQAAIAGGTLKLAPDTNAQNIGAAQAGKSQAVASILYVTSAMAAGHAGLTPESFLFTDTGTLRTLVP